MAQDQFKRKLTTILSADVAGYSRLMGDLSAATDLPGHVEVIPPEVLAKQAIDAGLVSWLEDKVC
jgi:hypothetical protein